jgi:hypothetical protein
MSEKILEELSAEDSRKWGLLSGIVGFALYFVLNIHMAQNKASLTALYVALTIFMVRVFWKLRGRAWFWTCMLMIVLLDFAIVVFIPVNYWPGPSIIVLGFAALTQFALGLSLIVTVQKMIKRISGQNSRANDRSID